MTRTYDRKRGVLILTAPGAPPAEVSLSLPDVEIDAAIADYAARYAPPAPVPSEVTMFQARAVLIRSGLFRQVNTTLGALDPETEEYQAWEYGGHVTRDGKLVAAMAAGLGLTDAQLDDLFRAAALIEA